MRSRSISLNALLVLAAAAFLSGARKCRLLPVKLAVDPSLSGSSDSVGMLEPFETVVVEPSWQQKVTAHCRLGQGERLICDGQGDFTCNKNFAETGTPVSLIGPIAGNYVLQDKATPYGTFAIDGTKRGGYVVFVSAPSGRPAPHWDATFPESLTGTRAETKSWTLHIGDSFWDVPRTSPFYKKVETLFHSGVTAGCAPGAFCPDAILARSDIAVFMARGLARGGANIPASGVVGTRSYNCAAGANRSSSTFIRPTRTASTSTTWWRRT